MITRRGLATAAVLLMAGSALSRLLGIVREQVIVGLFGATGTTSAFVAASTVPTMIYDLLIGGAISAALVPVFSDYQKERDGDRESLSQAASAILTVAALALALLATLLIALAPQLIALLAAGLDQESQSQASGLLRLMLPGVIFLGLTGIAGALLYARQRFAYPAFAISVYNMGLIACGLVLAPVLGINSLALGIVAGAIGQLVVHWPGLRDLRLRPTLDLRHPALRRVLRLYLPVALGLVVSQVGIIVDRNLASHTGADSLAVMRVATTLVQFPLGLVATALSFSILPGLSRLDSTENLEHFKRILAVGLRLALLAMLPATVGLVLLRVPMVQLLFEHGAFDARGTERTALAFLAYAPQLPFAAIDQLLVFAFYARKNTVTPMLVGVLGVMIYLAAGLIFIGPLGWGMPGLALANTVQNSLHAIILAALLWRVIGSPRSYGIGIALAKAVAASLVLGLVLLVASPIISTRLDLTSLMGQALYVGACLATGGGAYFLSLLALRTEEAAAALTLARAWSERYFRNAVLRSGN